MSILVYNTASVEKKQQFEFWNDLVCNIFIGLNCKNQRDSNLYKANLTYFNMENIEISMVECEQSRVYRTNRHISSATDDVFMLHLQIEGSSFNSQAGQEHILQPGDFVICQSSIPYALTFDRPIKMMVIKLPYSLVQTQIQKPSLLAGLKIPKSKGISKLLISHLLELWSLKEVLDDTVYRVSLSDIVISLLNSSVQQVYPELFNLTKKPRKETQIMRLKDFITENLKNPELTPSIVAANNGISKRYMRKIFNNAGVTCQRHITNQRIEAIAKELQDKNNLSQSISTLAFKWGFNNLSHFSNTFKLLKGISPKNYRKERP